MIFQQVINRNEQNHTQTKLGFHQHAPEYPRRNDQQLYTLPSGKEPQPIEHHKADGKGKEHILAGPVEQLAGHGKVEGNFAEQGEAHHPKQVGPVILGMDKTLHQQKREYWDGQTAQQLEHRRPGGQHHQVRVCYPHLPQLCIGELIHMEQAVLNHGHAQGIEEHGGAAVPFQRSGGNLHMGEFSSVAQVTHSVSP